MALTNAERQRVHRERYARRVAELERENAVLRAKLDAAHADLVAAHADNERLAGAACRHPAEAMDGTTCRACGSDVW